MKAVVLAGGFGTRLRERVPNLPKPMAPVAGRPFLEYILDRLISGGVDQVILSVGYQAEVIMNHFGNSYKNIEIRYAQENSPLGTGGAIAYAVGDCKNEAVLVLNGDTLLNLNYKNLIQWYLKEPVPVAMVLRELKDVARYGAVQLDNEKVVGFLEKGKNGIGYINTGVYLIQSDVFNAVGLSGKFSFETDFLQEHCATLQPGAFLTDAYFIDIGIPQDYDRAQRELPALS